MSVDNGAMVKVDTVPVPSPDLLGDLLGPLAIEGMPVATIAAVPASGFEAVSSTVGALALATIGEESNSVQVV